jgi:acyl carrier protein
MTDKIRDVLAHNARLSVDMTDVKDVDDLYGLGMTSHASVSVMLGLEEAFGVEFPEYMLRRATFTSIGSIRRSLDELLAAQGP